MFVRSIIVLLITKHTRVFMLKSPEDVINIVDADVLWFKFMRDRWGNEFKVLLTIVVAMLSVVVGAVLILFETRESSKSKK